MRRFPFWAWFWVALGGLYFFVPLYGTLDFSLRAVKDQFTLAAYERVLIDPRFANTFSFSFQMALWTIAASIVLVVPTAYWVHLRLPRLKPVIEFITLLPFVVPAIVLVFGMARVYGRPPLLMTSEPVTATILLVGGYVTLALPYMYRAVDTGLRAMDVRTLTEAAQSLGAGWPTILLRVILPNLRVAVLSGAFLTFTTVIGEFTFATYLAPPGAAFGPYMSLLGQTRAYEPAALAIMSLILTWGSVGLIQLIGRGAPRQGQLAGAR
ncbi:MAG: ABC transporter permease subunit [Chloroflexota bacterium]